MAKNAVAVAKQMIKHANMLKSSTSVNGYRLLRKITLTQTLMLSLTTTQSQFSYNQQRFLSSPSKPNSSVTEPAQMALIHSRQDLKSAFQNVQDESLPALFYFTAAWCSPCKFLSLTIDEMRSAYPHVNYYKIDIDQQDIKEELEKLQISAVPTIYFYENGKLMEEMVGADRDRLKKNMEKYYKRD